MTILSQVEWVGDCTPKGGQGRKGHRRVGISLGVCCPFRQMSLLSMTGVHPALQGSIPGSPLEAAEQIPIVGAKQPSQSQELELCLWK